MEWSDNASRGCSYIFGYNFFYNKNIYITYNYLSAKAATPFLNRNDFLSIIRAHEAQLDGYF